MNDFPRFDYRMKSDHTIEVICAVCRKEVGVTNDEFFLQPSKMGTGAMRRCTFRAHLELDGRCDMNGIPNFYYRMKPDLTCEITCAVCGQTMPVST